MRPQQSSSVEQPQQAVTNSPEPNTAITEELRQLASLRAAGFLDASLVELRYEAMVREDREAIRAAAACGRSCEPRAGQPGGGVSSR